MSSEKQVVLITGASSGFGQITAQYLGERGYKVYGTSRSVREPKGNYQMVPLDVQKADTIQQAVDQIIATEGRIDVLVNNAGVGLVGPMELHGLDEVAQVMDTNVYGVFRVTQAVLPHMRQQRNGRIINVSSISGLIGTPYRACYSASKAAVEALTESLSMEVKGMGISVCSLAPGDFDTGIGDRRVPLKRWMESGDYEEAMRKTGELIDDHVSDGADPILVAQMVHKICQRSNPKLHYLVGPPMQKLAVKLKRVLPDRLFERIIMSFYDM
ncbi:MAG: SDR family NAD(P)-dependent oxidoreductase [Bacteroidota bacterium]